MVLDRRYSPEADTGTFELAYRQTIPKAPAYLGLFLCINGKRLLKKPKERKHEPRSVTPMAPRETAGDAAPEYDQPIPSEYSGPIITDFLSWLNPYDALPTNKDGIVLAPKGSVSVRQALTVVKSGITLKSGSKKRKTSALSSRTHRGRREKNTECKRRIISHSCCRPNDDQSVNQAGRYRTESASITNKPKVDRSVGNKRCYIDPVEWERETASILRSTISVQNKFINRQDCGVPFRQSKSDVAYNTRHKSSLELFASRNSNESDSHVNLSAIGTNICKLRDENKVNKNITLSKSCNSIYAPYRVIVTPGNELSPNTSYKK